MTPKVVELSRGLLPRPQPLCYWPSHAERGIISPIVAYHAMMHVGLGSADLQICRSRVQPVADVDPP